MAEGFPTKKEVSEPSWEERFALLPDARRTELTQSWQAMEALIQRFEGAASQETLNRVEKIEHTDPESTKRKAQEIHQFLGKIFKPEENMDPMAHELALTHSLLDNHMVRDDAGEIISFFQSQLINMPVAEGKSPEAMFGVWYVETNPEYKGKPVTRELTVQALKSSLQKAKQQFIKLNGIIGETEPEVEKLFNRYGVERVYYHDKRGAACEVPYRAPPEDESDDGAPAHFSMKLFDNRKEMGKEEFMRVIKGVYAQYTRPEYFTAEYLKFAVEYYANLSQEQQEEAKAERITPAAAERYRQRYARKADRIRSGLEKELKNAKDGKLFFMSERERRAQKEQGKMIIDWGSEE